MAPKRIHRISVKLKNPNPLFDKWLVEWIEEAETHGQDLKGYKIALESLRKFPLPLQTGKDCKILKGFTKAYCKRIDRQLAAVNATDDVTAEGSGGYGILLALIKNMKEPGNVGYMTKGDITKNGQKYCRCLFDRVSPGSHYTTWESIRTLISKELVVTSKCGRSTVYSLTESGVEVAEKLLAKLNEGVSSMEMEPMDTAVETVTEPIHKAVETVTEPIHKAVEAVTEPVYKAVETSVITKPINTLDKTAKAKPPVAFNSAPIETIILPPNTFDIILIVDVNETVSGTDNVSELDKHDILYEVRDLKIGDFAWICRDRIDKHELVLPYIAERKRMDDLGHSIKDGRFHEQKFRLKKCGIQNLLYIIENYGNNTHNGLPLSSLMQAAMNTLVIDNFQVKFTQNLRHTMQYLAGFTMMLKTIFHNKTLHSSHKENLTALNISADIIPLMIFKDFNKGAAKARNFKVREMFIRHLLQLKGMSVDRALAIVEKYPTPALLAKALSKSGNKLLAGIPYGLLKRNIGPTISQNIYQLYTSTTLS